MLKKYKININKVEDWNISSTLFFNMIHELDFYWDVVLVGNEEKECTHYEVDQMGLCKYLFDWNKECGEGNCLYKKLHKEEDEKNS